MKITLTKDERAGLEAALAALRAPLDAETKLDRELETVNDFLEQTEDAIVQVSCERYADADAVLDSVVKQAQFNLATRRAEQLSQEVGDIAETLRLPTNDAEQLLRRVLVRPAEDLVAETAKSLQPLFGDKAENHARRSEKVQAFNNFRNGGLLFRTDRAEHARRLILVIEELLQPTPNLAKFLPAPTAEEK